MQSIKSVVIVGGGFGGVRTALNLSKKGDLEITLISNNLNFEYYPGLHKIVGVSRRPTYQVPLKSIFKNTGVKLVVDTVTDVNMQTKTVLTAANSYSADAIVVAVGSQTDYFNIEGLEGVAYGFKSVAEAKRLRAHIEEMFAKHARAEKTEAVVGLHMVIVGAGPNGVDLAGELSAFGKKLAKDYQIAESLLTIDLIEAGFRVLGMLPEKVSHRVEARLRSLGVNVLCNRDLKKDESWTVTLADMKMGARTLVWTAGVSSNELVKKINGLVLGRRNRGAVDEYLQAKGTSQVFENVFLIGDVADTPYSGLAQTAIYDGVYISNLILDKSQGKKLKPYMPRKNAYNIGVGRRWSVMQVGSLVMYGMIPYLVRTLIDIHFFVSILPLGEVWKMYFGKKN